MNTSVYLVVVRGLEMSSSLSRDVAIATMRDYVRKHPEDASKVCVTTSENFAAWQARRAALSDAPAKVTKAKRTRKPRVTTPPLTLRPTDTLSDVI